MARITLQEAQAWGEKTKLRVAMAEIDNALLVSIESEVLGALAAVADSATWIDSVTTPQLVKTIIAKQYVAWVIDRQYSEDDELSSYARLLRETSAALLAAILSGTVDIPDAVATGDGLPSVYPTDTTVDSYGQPYGPFFTMDMRH